MRITHNNLFRQLSSLLSRTPFHPQWLIFRNNYKSIVDCNEFIKGKVLDIGCGGCDIKKYLPDSIDYTGLDYYYTSVNWYKSSPDIFADAMNLPFEDSSFETVVIMDVLEHVKDARRCISQINGILKKQGNLIIQIPFLYPIHDAPLDFKRWTIYGLKELVENNNFQVVREYHKGQPFETAFLLINLAVAKNLSNWFVNKNPVVVLGILSPLLFLFLNIFAVLFSSLLPSDDFMPWAYRIVARKI